jgi:hypothetical protein
VEHIRDILLDSVPHFAPFVSYGAHQLYGKYEFEKEKSSNPVFAQFVEVSWFSISLFFLLIDVVFLEHRKIAGIAQAWAQWIFDEANHTISSISISALVCACHSDAQATFRQRWAFSAKDYDKAIDFYFLPQADCSRNNLQWSLDVEDGHPQSVQCWFTDLSFLKCVPCLLGISFKTQALYTLIFMTHYIDLLFRWVSVYNFVMKLFFISSSRHILYIMTYRFRFVLTNDCLPHEY